MKTTVKIITLILIATLFFSALTYAEEDWEAEPVEINALIPENTIWGISRDDFMKSNHATYTKCKVGNKKALTTSNIIVDEYTMDGYYIFDERMWDSEGRTYNGLSKITYLLSNQNDLTSSELDDCYLDFTEKMKNELGNPDSEKGKLTTWKNNVLKVEVGKGKFKKYTGSNKSNVAIVFTAIHIPKPETPQPTPKSTPKPAPKPTSKPTEPPQTASLEESNALRSAQSYLSIAPFSYNGLIDQLQYEGYSSSACKYAADHCGADWNEQAAKSAQDYLELMPFSKKELIEQLEYDGFTHQQAEYGAGQNGY